MQAVILAAGKGKRMMPLTLNRPKPLLPIAGKPMITYHVEKLRKLGVNKIVIVVNHNAERIEEELKSDDIVFVRQKEPLGTGDALRAAKNEIDEDFLMIYGDEYFTDSLAEMKNLENAIAVYEVEDVSSYGAIIVKNGVVSEIKEKSMEGKGYVFAGIAKFGLDVFDKLKDLGKSPRGEVELTDVLIGMKVYKLKGTWMDVGYPWKLLDANKIELDMLKQSVIKGKVEENVVIKGNVVIEEGTIVKSGSYIEGPVYIGKNCEIGPNAYIRPYTMLEDSVKVGNSCEVKNSIIMKGTKVPHFNYIGDSVVGENCNFGAGTKLANLRFDEKNVFVSINGKKIDTGRRKFGAIVGDNVKFGMNVSVMPGVRIGANSVIGASSLIYEDVPDNTYVRIEEKLVRRCLDE